eukprot:Skav232561  [mRNA]  locus=scaffold3309:99724:104567:- [translate_table: standard]
MLMPLAQRAGVGGFEKRANEGAPATACRMAAISDAGDYCVCQPCGGDMQKSQSEGSLAFLKDSKVGSAAGFMLVSGGIMALPHGKKSKGLVDFSKRFSAISEYQDCFREIPHCYASMDRKPLVPYHPNAPRSRLALEDAPVPLKNASTIRFFDRFCVHNRRFVSTHKNYYTGEKPDMRSNPGMIADSTRLKPRHSLMIEAEEEMGPMPATQIRWLGPLATLCGVACGYAATRVLGQGGITLLAVAFFAATNLIPSEVDSLTTLCFVCFFLGAIMGFGGEAMTLGGISNPGCSNSQRTVHQGRQTLD